MTSEVVIAGGGPNGLMLACELALAGVRPTVLERLPGPNPLPKANGMVGQVVRAMDYRGLYERITGSDGPPGAPPYFPFAAFPLPLHELAEHSLFALPIPQRKLEKLLGERAAELGAEIRHGHEVTGFTQDESGIRIEVTGPDGGYELLAEYLVGADGAHSIVRKLAGIGFLGDTDDAMISRTGSVRLPAGFTDPETGDLRVPGIGHIKPFGFTRTETGVLGYGRFRADVHTLSLLEWDASTEDDDPPMTLAELRAAARRVLGVDIPMTLIDLAEAPDQVLLRRLPGRNTRQADRYRAGRVFLVGDSAHVFSGIGGPGLNLGLQDAMNLGWKLAAQVSVWAPPGLLDSYHTERHPVGERVLHQTRAQSALLAPGPDVTALRWLFGELLADRETVRRIADLMAGSDVRYGTGTHPLTGRCLPDLALTTEAGPTRVAVLMRRARPLLLDLAGRPDLAAVAADWKGRVDVIEAQCSEPPADVLLVRPDGYVAVADPDTATLRTALTEWFGEPVTGGEA
jgi:2-polyprenyl-6-methoxyphenol hydroxylase-like FAD-dependent oxidoreductase